MSHAERHSADVAVPTGYNTPIPAQITTPDRVETRIGSLEFRDGVPSEETAPIVFDKLDFSRGVKAFLDCIPPASIEAMRRGNKALGVDACHKVLIMDRLSWKPADVEKL